MEKEEDEADEGVEEDEVEEDISFLTPVAIVAMAAEEASRLSRSRDRARSESARAWHTS